VIGRRHWLGFAGAAVAATALAQSGVKSGLAPRRIGWLSLGEPWTLAPFRERLRELGWVEGENLAIEARWARNDLQRLPRLADELVASRVEVLVTQTTPAALAARQATTTVPIVMAGVVSPVYMGIVDNLERPGGNATGITHLPLQFSTKRAQMLIDAAPRVRRLAMLDQDDTAEEGLRIASAWHRREIVLAVANRPGEVPALLESLRDDGVDGLLVSPVPVIEAAAPLIVDFARRQRWPSSGGSIGYARAGGLMSYWADWVEIRRQAAEYVDRILRGVPPGDLPIAQPSRYQLVLNLATAKAIGVEFPHSMRVRADEIVG